MKKLLEYIIKGILGKKDFTVTESTEGDFVNLGIKVPDEDIGLIIGKEGKTIKAIRNLLKVRATLERRGVSVSIEE
ncbi:MAG: KH domain-containing protein [bacterium]|nr:KH domain-containing protein [bacterium]